MAESLTGGLVVATLVDVPGASAVVRGGVVAYATPVKHVGARGLGGAAGRRTAPCDPEVARQMAAGVRIALAVDGEPATWGISTTGVAGPDPQDGKPVGTVFVGIASAAGAEAFELHLDGDRGAIRHGHRLRTPDTDVVRGPGPGIGPVSTGLHLTQSPAGRQPAWLACCNRQRYCC